MNESLKLSKSLVNDNKTRVSKVLYELKEHSSLVAVYQKLAIVYTFL